MISKGDCEEIMEKIIEEKVNELMKNANEKYSLKDYSIALEIYEKILKIDSINNEAMIYSLFCKLRLISISALVSYHEQGVLMELIKTLLLALYSMKNQLEKNPRKYIDSCLEIYQELVNIVIYHQNEALSFYQKVGENYIQTTEKINRIMQSGMEMHSNFHSLLELKQTEMQLRQQCNVALNYYKSVIRILILMNNTAALGIINSIEDFSLISSTEVQNFFDSVNKIYHFDDNKDIQTKEVKKDIQTTLDSIQNKKEEAKCFEIQKYWEDKPERKKELLDIKDKYYHERLDVQAEIKKIQTEIEKLTNDIDKSLEVERKKKETAIQNQSEYINKKKSLGLFKIKEKASLQNKIDEIQIEINQIDTKINDEKIQLMAKYKPKIDEHNKKIMKLEKDIEKLNQKEELINKELYLEED